MKKPLSAIVLLLVGFLLSWLLLTSKEKPLPQPVVTAAAAVVDIVYAQPATHQLYVHTQGTVQPAKEIDIVAQVAGIVQTIDPQFANGAFFQKGQRLLNIEDADYRFALIRAEANVAEAKQVLAVERARAAQAVKEWRDLGQEDANALSLRKPQLASALAKLRAAEADRDEAKLNLDRTAIKAPFNGRVRMKYADEGQYVSLGTPIAKLYATEKAEVRLPLTDKQLALLDFPLGLTKPDTEFPRVDFEVMFAGEEQNWRGKLVRTEASVDIKSRVIYAIAEITNPYSTNGGKMPLHVGMFVNAKISGRVLDKVIRLPRKALQVDQQILVVNEFDDLQVKPVDILQANRTHVVLKGDIRGGERIVVSNMPMAVTGMRVSPRENQTDAAFNTVSSGN